MDVSEFPSSEAEYCGRQVSVIAGTIFEQSKKPFALWFRAIFDDRQCFGDVLTAFVENQLGHGETAHTDGWR